MADPVAEAGTDVFWLELREPGCIPERKGSFPIASTAKTIREFMDARPAAFITVVTVTDGAPMLQDGPECLLMADGRSVARARRHIVSSKEAHRGNSPHLESELAAERERNARLVAETIELCARIAERNSSEFDFLSAAAECRDREAGFHSGRINAATAIRALAQESKP